MYRIFAVRTWDRVECMFVSWGGCVDGWNH